MIVALRQHRIDALVEQPFAVWVVEVDVRLSKRVIGSVIANRNLLKQKIGSTKDIKMAVVVGEGDQELEIALKDMGISLYVV